MKCIIFLSIQVVLSLSQNVTNEIPKCCNNGQQVEIINSTWICKSNSNKRLQSTFENNGFLSGNTSGICVDTVLQNESAIFFLDENKNITKKEIVKMEIFPKCCHLGRNYDQKLHSCVTVENSTAIRKYLPKNFFVSVGLKHCKIISDVVLASLENFSFPSNFIYLSQTNKNVSKGNFCIDSTLDFQFVVRICEKDFEICNRIRCIHKCCFDGQSFVNGSKCRDTFRYGIDLHATHHFEDPDSPFAIVHGIQRPLQIFKEHNKIHVDKNGIFSSYIPSDDSYARFGVETDSYCMEYAYKKGPGNRTLDKYSIFGKIVLAELEAKISLTRWVKIVSCIFLLLTIIVYAVLPKLRNLFGKILLSYCVAMFLTFNLLTITQFFQQDFGDEFCKIVGYSLVFFSFCSFTWMHIICIDIWYSFGSPRTLSGPLQRNERKKLFLYSLYGWGFPMLWVLLIIFFNETEILPESIHPYVGQRECYFENYDDRKGNYAFTLFITLPMAIQQIVNIVFFIRTVMHCIRVKSEISRMNHNSRSKNDYNAGREKLYLVLKLAVVMGMMFLFETISSIRKMNVNPVTEHIEIVWDTINCLQGVFIFIIFICKKTIYDNLCEKWRVIRGYSPTSTTKPESIQSQCTNDETLNLDEKPWKSTISHNNHH